MHRITTTKKHLIKRTNLQQIQQTSAEQKKNKQLTQICNINVKWTSGGRDRAPIKLMFRK